MTQYAPTATDIVPHNIPTGTPTYTASATATLTPCCGTDVITVTPRPSTTPVNGIVEVNSQEIEWLAATCWIEGRGFGDRRVDLCTSVVSTIMLRARTRQYSDGTVFGTLTYNCTPESETCAFPAWAVNGCEGIIPQVCPFYDTQGMIDFRAMANTYLEGDYPAPCDGYLYYGSRESDMRADACIVDDGNGHREAFYN